MQLPVDFSPTADDQWDHIINHDVPLAKAIDPLLDDIESGELVGQRLTNAARFTTLRMPGRDEVYVIFWENRDGYRYVNYIGKLPS
ncbi:MAG: hypothetical protein CMH36_00075 [Microbacterium sp.]|uniref:hypothetical protein n=1 Tax=uncultured Microbacterium sp. TaxID=191216 RepID=UPI000C8BFDB0|nr:hypothetical protein [uncultured Microbacterium sp.]MAL05254.1 hypothetical protein [Microbacterium sp.]|tara:strand:- start:124 stop:381 length:258 start_codon:yes stop_codon:yes gene_type:complete